MAAVKTGARSRLGGAGTPRRHCAPTAQPPRGRARGREKDGCALEYASEALRNDREIVLAAVAKYMRAFQYASKALRADRETFGCNTPVLLAAVAQNGFALEYASEALRNHREVVLAAVAWRSAGARVLVDASHELRADREVRADRVARGRGGVRGRAQVRRVLEALRNDREVVADARPWRSTGTRSGTPRRRCATTAKSPARGRRE